jgi:hypothetical protein
MSWESESAIAPDRGIALPDLGEFSSCPGNANHFNTSDAKGFYRGNYLAHGEYIHELN